MATLVTTVGRGSMDLYVQKLAQNLDVPKLYCDIYQQNARLFNVSFLSQEAVKTVWRDWRFIRMLNRLDGVIHLPNHHLGRYGCFLRNPYIITVHDLIRYFDLKGYSTFIHRPNLRDRLYLSLDYRGVQKAARVIAVSQTTKGDLMQHLGIAEERISVVYEGIDHRVFRPVERRPADYPYLLFVGSEHPRKNLSGLLRALAKLKSERRFKDLKLVKVGEPGGREAEFRKHTLRLLQELDIAPDVVFTGYVAEEELPAYYSGAECFVLPSFYEGFGFPPLEAMACGCPVIVSNVASLPEITGEAAVKVDPQDVDALCRALREVLTNDGWKRELVSKGFAWAGQFSWERAARETLQVYESVERSRGAQQAPTPVVEGAAAMPPPSPSAKTATLTGAAAGNPLPMACPSEKTIR